MTNLQNLNARGNCGIDQNGIQVLKLIELNAQGNANILLKWTD